MALEDLKAHYRRGGLGDIEVKRRLDGILQALLAPIRERRAVLARDPDYIRDVLQQGTLKALPVRVRLRSNEPVRVRILLSGMDGEARVLRG